MKKLFLFSSCVIVLTMLSEYRSTTLLTKYKKYLDDGTYMGQDWTNFSKLPASRYETFKLAFEHFEQINGKVIVELGTSRSYVHGGLPGCNSNDKKFWTPNQPENWDWGAGFFTYVCAEALFHLKPEFYTVDLIPSHLNRCQYMTRPFKSVLHYNCCSSVDFLRNFPEDKKIDLLYIDTGDMTPIEPTALLQLEEAKIIVERNLISENGIILIDDVKNQTPRKFGETSPFGKAKYSLPFFLNNGFIMAANEYQVILLKNHDQK